MMKTFFYGLFVSATAGNSVLAAGHDGDLLIGSSLAGSGSLIADFDFSGTPDVLVSEFFSFGNGTSLFTATEPGFDAATNEPSEGVYALANGTAVGLRLLSADPGVAIQANGILLDEPGETVVLGTFNGGEELHVHPTFRLQAASTDTALHDLQFELFQTNGSTYAGSAPYTMTLSTAVPEPASVAMLAVIGGGLLRRRRN